MRIIFSLGPTHRIVALAAIAVSVFFLVAASPTHASPDSGLIQCGRQFFNASSENTQFCTICDLISLAQNLMNQAITYFAAPIAALMLGYGGFLMVIAGVRGGSAQSFTQGKKVLTNAVIGIVILFTAWLMVDTLLKSIGYSTANFGPWNVIQCESPAISVPSHHACNAEKQCVVVKGLKGGDECKPDSKLNNCVEHYGCNPEKKVCELVKTPGLDSCKGADDTETCAPAAEDICKGVICNDSNVDTYKPDPKADCVLNGNYNEAILEGMKRSGKIVGKDIITGENIDTLKMVKAIMAVESHGSYKPSAKGACGPMQIVPSRIYASECRVDPDEVDKTSDGTCPPFYQNPDNLAASVCIAVKKMINASTRCGKSLRGIAAGYNGGGDACNPSVDCGSLAGSGQCKINAQQTGDTVRWECPYENPAHTACNAGRKEGSFEETRRYAPKVMQCYNQF